MRFSEKLKPEDLQFLVVLGDGKYERRILRYILPKFDGRNVTLSIPSLPRGVMTAKKTGLAVLESLITLLNLRYSFNRVIFLVDREHISGMDEIDEWLKEHGCVIDSRVMLNSNKGAAIYHITHGDHEFELYVALAGRHKCIEEELFELAGRVYGKSFDKRRIKSPRFIKRLIEKAGAEDIKKCLRNLSIILQKIEEEYRDQRI